MLLALVRPPTASIEAGSRAVLGREPIDFHKAQEQHQQYALALSEAGAEVIILPPVEHSPRAAFVGQAACVLDELAVIARTDSADSKAAACKVTAALSRHRHLAQPPEVMTLDGGDFLAIDRRIYVGMGVRSTPGAATYLCRLLGGYGYDVIPILVTNCTHLKSAVTYLGNNTVLLNPRWVPARTLAKHSLIEVDPSEPRAADTLRVGSTLLMSASYPATLERLRARGFKPVAVDISEFHKAEGDLSSLLIVLETA